MGFSLTASQREDNKLPHCNENSMICADIYYRSKNCIFTFLNDVRLDCWKKKTQEDPESYITRACDIIAKIGEFLISKQTTSF